MAIASSRYLAHLQARLTSRCRNIVHRHEPPVTSKPVRILHVDKEKEFIVVDKPGSIVRVNIEGYPLLTEHYAACPRNRALLQEQSR